MKFLAPALAGVLGCLVLAATPAAAHGPNASFDFAPASPDPGEVVTLRSTSTPTHGSTVPMGLSWDLDADGQFDDAQGALAHRSFPAGSHVVRLLASHGDDHETVVEKTVAVGDPAPAPTPTPAAPASEPNQPPAAAFEKDCRRSGTFVMCAGLFAREGKPHTIDASRSHDPDGSIVRYQWDLDGNGSFERDGGALPAVQHTFQAYSGLVDPRKRTVRVRVTDDDGATAEAELTLSLLEPSCEGQVTHGRLRATSPCLRHRVREVAGKPVDRWYSERPVVLNGITITPAAGKLVVIDLPGTGSTAAPAIHSGGATISAPSAAGDVRLFAGRFSWRLADGKTLQGFELDASARLNGLRITGMPAPPQLEEGGSSRLGVHVALPQQFGGATSDEPIVISPGKAVAAAGTPLTFGVADAAIGPIGLRQLLVSYDGVDLWEISAAIQLPPPLQYTIEGGAGIRGGDFEYARAGLDFGNGVPVGPVFLKRISFRVEVAPKESDCVPKVGIEYFDQRKLLHDITGKWFDVPNFEIDHGIPTFALCGEVALTAGPTVLDVAAIRLDAGLGLATYADRPAVFRAFGDVSLVDIPLAEADFEVHTNGYARMSAGFDWGIDGLVSLEGFLLFEMLAPKFNALAHVDACLEFVDWCAGARAIVSSRGVAVCLKIDVLVDDWEPGFGYRWGDLFPTLYFAGCDIGEYREHIDSGIDEHITAVPARARAMASGAERAIELPAGLPGATVVAKGATAPPTITLVGPNGERVSTPDDLRPVERKPFLLLKDPRANLTQIAVGRPAGGRWKVIVEPGSSPVVSLKSAEGLEKPRVRARVTGSGGRRTLTYGVKPLAGQKVTFVERGPSAGDRIGGATAAHGRIRFTPAPGSAERRRIVALVEQDGRLREEIVVARYRAPAAARPARVRGLRVARRGKALRLAWRATRGADLHEVQVRLSDGRRRLLRTRRAAITVRGVQRGVRGTVTVRGLTRGGLKSRPVTARLPRAHGR